MENKKQSTLKLKKKGADRLIERTNRDPHGNLFYHSVIHKGAIAGGIIGGVIFAFIAYMFASGNWAVTGLGQIAASGNDAAIFFGFVLGSAAGALAGSIYGIVVMLNKN